MSIKSIFLLLLIQLASKIWLSREEPKEYKAVYRNNVLVFKWPGDNYSPGKIKRGFLDTGWTININKNDLPPSYKPNSQIQFKSSITNKIHCRTVCSGELIFEDNFETLNWQKWQREVRIPIGDDAEFVSYQNRSENCYIRDGVLRIVPELLSEIQGFDETSVRLGALDLTQSCTRYDPKECKISTLDQKFVKILPPIVSARIRTKETFQFRYGKVVVRAKLPKGDWIYPLIILEPANNIYGTSNYSSGQLRVAFARGNLALIDDDNNIVQGGAVLSSHPDYLNVRLPQRRTIQNLRDKFHIYSLTWTDKYISLALDGQEYAKLNGGFDKLLHTHYITHAGVWKSGGYMAPFDVEFFLTLGVSVGGNLEFPDSPEKPWLNRDPNAALHFWNARQQWKKTWNGVDAGLHVDYIRVYAV